MTNPTESVKFDAEEILRHTKSGKLYMATGYNGCDSGRVGVYGWRNGKQFGPVRFIEASNLERAEATGK